MSVRRLRSIVPMLASIGLTVVFAAGTAEAGPDLRPGVVVDTEHQQIFLMRPGGGIEAVSWNTGETQWLSERGDQPILSQNGRLLALVDAQEAGSFTLVSLDGESGRTLQESQLEMAPDLWAKVDQGLSSHFQITADQPSADDSTRLSWSYNSWTAQGARPATPASGPRNLKQSEGYLTFRWADGNLRQGEERAATQTPRAISLSGDQALQGVGEGRQFLSSDGRHVAVSLAIAADPVRFKYQWRLYTRDGQSLGSLQAETSYSPFMVQGSTLVVESPEARRRADAQSPWVETPLSLRAVDLRGGGELWTRPLRDTRYRGPLPP